jgi:hypothetical protein
MSDYGSGIEFTEATRTILGVFAGAIVSFLLVFVYVVYRVTNEIIIARRYVRPSTCIMPTLPMIACITQVHLMGTHFRFRYRYLPCYHAAL